MARYYRKKSNNYGGLITFLAVVLVVLVLFVVGIKFRDTTPELRNPPETTTVPPTSGNVSSNNPTQPTTEPTTEPTTPPKPEVTLVSTAKITATGDILMHGPCIQGGKVSDGYDFTPYFRYIQDYVLDADYAVANLETTLAGPTRE